MLKTFKHFLRNQMAYDLETCIIGDLGPIKFVHMMA